jgi:hypothetical protein
MRLLVVLSVIAMVGFLQHDHQACTSFTPENEIYVPENSILNSGLTEAEVRQVADQLYDLYAAKFSALKRSLVFNIQWSEDKFNAYTNLWRGKALIVMTGGMIRHPLVNLDGLTLVLCHEIGHHLAGKPKHTRGFGTSFASAEGQSDYFSTLKCMRKFLLEQPDNSVDESKLPVSVVQNCKDSFQDSNMQNICMRSVLASETMAKVLNAIRSNRVPNLDIETPDPTVVKKHFLKHPNPQCRLDTYYAGALCDVDHEEDIDIKKDGVAQCTRKKGFTKGLRPNCWYKS